MNTKIFTVTIALMLCLLISESKAQQESSDKPPIRIEKGGSITDIPGTNIRSLQTNYEVIEIPQQQIITKDFSSVVKTQKGTEADYPHKRILLQGESVIFEVSSNTVRLDTSHFEFFSPEIETAISRTPLWLQEDLRLKFRVISNTPHRTMMVNLLNTTEKKYLDELAFMLAFLPYEVLMSSRFINDWDYLIENAKMIYTFANSLKYVRLVEYGDTATGNWYTTTEYKIKQGNDFIWREIDKYYYYMFIVMPKLHMEGVYITDNSSSSDQRTWGYGW